MRSVSRFIYALLVVVVVSSVGFGCSSSDTEGSSSPVSGEFSAGNGGTVENNQGVSVEVSGDAVSGTTVVKVKITVIGDYAVFDDAAYEALGQAVEVTSEPAGATFDDGKVTVTMPCDADKSRVRIIELDEADDDSWSVGSVDIECDESSDTYTFSVSKTGVFALVKPSLQSGGTVLDPQAVALGGNHTCSIDGGDSKLYCWGENDEGQLGIDGADSKVLPQKVELNGTPKAIALGDEYSCAIVEVEDSDNLYCWGDNQYGQLGLGDTNNRLTPQMVTITGTLSAVSLGSLYSCAIVDIDSSTDLYCWGYNLDGQLGLGNQSLDEPTPQKVELDGNVTSVAQGFDHTCAVVNGSSDLYCWGNNFNGQLGLGNNQNTKSPKKVEVSGAISAVACASGGNTCTAVEVGGVNQLRCWGDNDEGQLGYGDMLARGGTPETTPDKLPAIQF